MIEHFNRRNKEECHTILLSCQSYFWTKFHIHIDLEKITSTDRHKNIIFQRALVCLYLRKRGFPLLDIAIVINKISHATVLNLLKYGTKREGRDDRWSDIREKITDELSQLDYDYKIKWHKEQIEKLEKEYNLQFGSKYFPRKKPSGNKDAALAYFAIGHKYNMK